MWRCDPIPESCTIIMDVLRKRLSMWSPPPWCWMTHDGLCRLRIIFKSASCVKLTCVINTDLVAINYVNGSRYLVVVMFEVIISMVSEALLGMCTCAFKKCGVRRNVCVERLGSVRYIHRTALVNRVKHKKASLQRTERPRANSSELPRPPCIPHSANTLEFFNVGFGS